MGTKMTHDEAIKTIRDYLTLNWSGMSNERKDALAALDSLAVEPSEDMGAKPRTDIENDAISLIRSLERVRFTDYCDRQGIALITARDERIRREMAESIIDEAKKLCKRWWWRYSQALDSMLRAVIG